MLNGKTALITGASRGIGREIALAMARQGASIAVVYAANEQAAQTVCDQIQALGAAARPYRCNVADYEQTQSLVKQVVADFGAVDILVNNAGVTRDKLILQMDAQDFDHVVDVNLKGAFYMIKHLYSHFIRRRSGRILNIASIAGLCGNAGQANYAAAKAGLIGLTKTVAKELAGRGVCCNAIAPGYIDTDMTAAMPQGIREQALGHVPMKRMGSAQEVAALAVFLASDQAGYITGEVIRVDGGLCM